MDMDAEHGVDQANVTLWHVAAGPQNRRSVAMSGTTDTRGGTRGALPLIAITATLPQGLLTLTCTTTVTGSIK